MVKEIDPNQIESPEQQENRARERLRPKALVTGALIAGTIVLFFPATPWMSHEGLVSAMGRLLAQNAVINVVAHYIIVFVYGLILAGSIYRLPTGGGILAGTALFAPLYGLNVLIFVLMLGYRSNEWHVGLAHFMFCLFFAVAYKATAVPRPRWKGSGRPVEV
jgi:hypothetical protein